MNHPNKNLRLQEEWHERNNSYLERHRKALERATELEALKRKRQSKSLILEGFIQILQSQNSTLDEFDYRLWMAAVSKVTVNLNGELVFELKDGTVI